MSSAQWYDGNQRQVLDGTLVTTGGGSQPGIYVLSKRQLNFQETPGAGTYTASLVLPAGARILDTPFFVLAGPWDADTAFLEGTDGSHSYYGAGQYPLINDGADNGIYKPYDPISAGNDLWGGGGVASWGDPVYSSDYFSAASWYALGLLGASGSAGGVPYPAGVTLTFTVVTTGAGGSTGSLVLDVIGFGVPIGAPIDAVKT